MANVFKLLALYEARAHRQGWMFAFQGLDTCHFIGAHHAFAFLSQFWRLFVQAVDVVDFLVKVLILGSIQPIAYLMRFETTFF